MHWTNMRILIYTIFHYHLSLGRIHWHTRNNDWVIPCGNPTRAAGMRRGDRTVSFSLHWQLSCQVWQLCVKKRIGVSKRKWKIWHRVHTLLVRDEHTLQKTLKTFPDSPFYRVESSIPVKRNGRTIKNCPMLLYLSVAEILKINSLPPCPYTVDPASFSQMRFRLIKLSRNE